MKALVGGDCVVIMIICASLLLGCSGRGEIVLHNASGADINVIVFDYQYQLSSSDTKRVRVDPVLGMHTFAIHTQNDMWCYEMPKVETTWIRAGFLRARAFLLLDGSGRLYLYSSDSDEGHFYERSPPVQPPGFPLEPSTQDGCQAP